ncbi:bacteriophage abortive infection AbiH family protein [Marinobacter daepoensis]|uniref:bacteriophage abortive infection AbiH family protein n=1 Tax=Marinobacter daepoensis TaxID=262077 RepID=UPI001C98C0ED|nr:bacteriophage abortive infection AbiH family protein [Marinobacter daepoensis]
MTTLVIIGNGFDIQNGLPTSYRDFHNLYSSELNSSLEYFPNFYNDQEWSCFEENLAVFDEDNFRENSAWEPSMDEMVESSKYAYGFNDEIDQKVGDLVDSIHTSFNAWVKSIDVNNASRFMKFPEDCTFISFNYTPTLQQVYRIPDEKVLHIHGRVGGYIIFGHGSGDGNKEHSLPFDENEPWFDDAHHSLASVTDKLYKPVSEILDDNRSTLENYGDVSKVIVIGHSINEIDIPYFKLVLDSYPNAKWENWNYGEGISESHEILLSLGVDESKLSSACSSKLSLIYPWS